MDEEKEKDRDTLGLEAGLCGSCIHRQIVRSPRSVFLRCALADTDPRFPRYPHLPVVKCPGYRAE